MRRLTSCIGIALLTLLVNGWGVVLAVALCPHGGAHQREAMAENSSGCHAQKSQSPSGHSRHHSSHDAKRVVTEARQSSEAALTQQAGSCAHCISRTNLPTTLAEARELSVKRVETSIASPVEPVSARSLGFAPSFIPTQHAPPNPSSRKHLLLGVLLI
jgi:hypothetical protein